MTTLQIGALVGSAIAAGILNALAGGGTLLTFPTLLLIGVPAIRANATSTVALLPGTLSSMAGYRREVGKHREWLKTLLLPSLAGGTVGCVLLLETPERIFAALAPWLVLFATVLFIFQTVSAHLAKDEPPREIHARHWVAAWLCQFAVAVYGGYFGAGVGIPILVILGFLGLRDIHAMNGVRTFFGFCINAVAAAYFAFRGAVDWPAALVMMAGGIAGGYAGALFARRIGKEKARAAVIAIGLSITAVLLARRL